MGLFGTLALAIVILVAAGLIVALLLGPTLVRVFPTLLS